ncbi:hypothetical protein, partial [Bilophila wadsworthia]|uniref:hypothetical protein n=1 Tax=Bilophila wadsworthia TaxID=35833 RepID=UPI003AB49013
FISEKQGFSNKAYARQTDRQTDRPRIPENVHGTHKKVLPIDRTGGRKTDMRKPYSYMGR